MKKIKKKVDYEVEETIVSDPYNEYLDKKFKEEGKYVDDSLTEAIKEAREEL